MVELCVSLLFSVLVLCPARLQVSLTGLVSCLYLTDSKMKMKLNPPPPPPLCDASSYQMRVWREDVGLGEHLCRLITSLTSAPTIPRACMLQRSMYTSTKPLFTSSSSQLFTFIYLSLFFICRSHHRRPLAL